jgi:hypothetical protein
VTVQSSPARTCSMARRPLIRLYRFRLLAVASMLSEV